MKRTQKNPNSLKNLKPFKPGQSGNPDGRPKRKPITDAYLRLMDELVPNDPERRTYAQLIALGQVRAAIKGSTMSAREIADRLEGKAAQAVEIVGDGETIRVMLIGAGK